MIDPSELADEIERALYASDRDKNVFFAPPLSVEQWDAIVCALRVYDRDHPQRQTNFRLGIK